MRHCIISNSYKCTGGTCRLTKGLGAQVNSFEFWVVLTECISGTVDLCRMSYLPGCLNSFVVKKLVSNVSEFICTTASTHLPWFGLVYQLDWLHLACMVILAIMLFGNHITTHSLKLSNEMLDHAHSVCNCGSAGNGCCLGRKCPSKADCCGQEKQSCEDGFVVIC